RNDDDRQLGRLRIDVSVAVQPVVEQPEPAGADGVPALGRDVGGVAAPSPAVAVTRDRDLGIERRQMPVVRKPEQRPHELDVHSIAAPDLDAHSASDGSSRKRLTVRRKSAAGAPSTARWSTVSVSVIIGRTATSPSTATGRSVVAPTARIAACGGGGKAEKSSTPNKPAVGTAKRAPSSAASLWPP